jgi:hypothetical protein
MTQQFLVPTLDVSWDDISEALVGLGANEQEPQTGDLQSWRLDGSDIILFEDPGLHLEQLVVEGDDAAEVAEQLRGRIPTYSPSDMPALFEDVESDDELIEKLAILAAVAPAEAEPRLMEFFRIGFNSPDSIVRERTALASAVPRWPELRKEVKRLADGDPDEDVRETAVIALRSFDKSR